MYHMNSSSSGSGSGDGIGSSGGGVISVFTAISPPHNNLSNYLRITIGTEEANKLVISSLEELLK